MLCSKTVSTRGNETNCPNINDHNDNIEFPFLTLNLLISSKRKLLEIYSLEGCVLFNTKKKKKSQSQQAAKCRVSAGGTQGWEWTERGSWKKGVESRKCSSLQAIQFLAAPWRQSN